MADATAKAHQYAEASGRSLGEVLLVTEDTGAGPVVAYEAVRDSAVDFAAGSVPIRAGSADTKVTVSVVWSLE